MKSTAKSKQPPRLSKEELRKSRKGLLGRFPAPDLYEPEPEDDLQPQGEGEQLKARRQGAEGNAKSGS